MSLVRTTGVVIGIGELKADMELLKKKLKSGGINLYRARKYKTYAIELVSGNRASLYPLTEATKFLSQHTTPEYNAGELLKQMMVKKAKGGAAEAGYFRDSGKIPGKNITYTQAAILQHTGYRIPLTGEKGRKVRAWYAKQGLFEHLKTVTAAKNKYGKAGGWIIVKPRPFMFTTIHLFVNRGFDVAAAKEWVDKNIFSSSGGEE